MTEWQGQKQDCSFMLTISQTLLTIRGSSWYVMHIFGKILAFRFHHITSYGILHLIFNPKSFLDIFRKENNYPQLNFWWFRSILLSSSSSYPHSNPRKVDTRLHHLKIQAIVKFWSSLDFPLRFLENLEQNKIYFWAL